MTVRIQVDGAALALELIGMKPDTVYMPVPRCGSCRHWLPWNLHLQGEGACAKVGFRPPFPEPSSRGLGGSVLALVSTNGREAQLNTHESFGCVQHEECQ